MECCRRAIVIVSTKTNYLLAACNNIKHFAVGASYLQPPLKEIAAQVALTEMRIKAIAGGRLIGTQKRKQKGIIRTALRMVKDSIILTHHGERTS